MKYVVKAQHWMSDYNEVFVVEGESEEEVRSRITREGYDVESVEEDDENE